MSRVTYLKDQTLKSASVFLQFKFKYKRCTKDIYVFFEGKDDISFYMPILRAKYQLNGEIHVFICDGKSTALKVHHKIHPYIDNSAKALFFLDKDIDNFFGFKKRRYKNIYMTPTYSIENLICNFDTIKIIWTDFLKLDITDERIKTVKIKFNKAQKKFYKEMLPVTTWISYQRSIGKDIYLNNINVLKHILTMDKNGYTSRKQNVLETLSKICGGCDKCGDVALLIKTCKTFKKYPPKQWVRGKFELEIFTGYINKLIDCLNDPKRLGIKNKKVRLPMNINKSNIIDVISGRIEHGSDLIKFLDHNLSKL